MAPKCARSGHGANPRSLAPVVELWNNHAGCAPPASRSSSPPSASAPPAPRRRSGPTASRPRSSAPRGSSSAARCSSLVAAGSPARSRTAGPALGTRAGRARPPPGVAAYQLAFFAAVADTGVAVGTIVALGSAPAITGALEWLVRAPPPRRPLVRRRPRSPAPAWRCSRSRAAARPAISAAGRRARASSPARPTPPTRWPPSGCSQHGHAPEPVMAAAFGARRRRCWRPCCALGDPAVAAATGGGARARPLPRRRADRARLRAVRPRPAAPDRPPRPRR